MLVYLLFQSEFSVCLDSGEIFQLVVLFSIKKILITEIRSRVNALELFFRLYQAGASVADHELTDVCLLDLKQNKTNPQNPTTNISVGWCNEAFSWKAGFTLFNVQQNFLYWVLWSNSVSQSYSLWQWEWGHLWRYLEHLEFRKEPTEYYYKEKNMYCRTVYRKCVCSCYILWVVKLITVSS